MVILWILCFASIFCTAAPNNSSAVLISKYAKVAHWSSTNNAEARSNSDRLNNHKPPRVYHVYPVKAKEEKAATRYSNVKEALMKERINFDSKLEPTESIPGVGEVFIQERFNPKPYFGFLNSPTRPQTAQNQNAYSSTYTSYNPPTQVKPPTAINTVPYPPNDLAPPDFVPSNTPTLDPPYSSKDSPPTDIFDQPPSLGPPLAPQNTYLPPIPPKGPPKPPTSIDDEYPPTSDDDDQHDHFLSKPSYLPPKSSIPPKQPPSSTSNAADDEDNFQQSYFSAKPSYAPPKPPPHSGKPYFSPHKSTQDNDDDKNVYFPPKPQSDDEKNVYYPPKPQPDDDKNVYFPPSENGQKEVILDHPPPGYEEKAPNQANDGQPHNFGDFPQYLYNDHHFPYDDHHVYKEVTTTTTEAPRVSSGHYSYYYLGRKLWYIPLYFSVYFILYVLVLIVKSIARHKVQLKHDYLGHHHAKEARSLDINTLHHNVEVAINKTHKKYVM